MAVIQQTVYEVLEAGEYGATVSQIETADGQYGPQLKWQFSLEGDRRLSAWTSQTFSAKSKLWKWTAAALGRDIPRGYTLDTDFLIGRPVRVIVTVTPGRDGEDYNRIGDVLPPRRTAPTANGAGYVAPLFEEEEVPF